MIINGFRVSVDPEDNDGYEIPIIGTAGNPSSYGSSMISSVKLEVSSHEEEYEEELEEE